MHFTVNDYKTGQKPIELYVCHLNARKVSKIILLHTMVILENTRRQLKDINESLVVYNINFLSTILGHVATKGNMTKSTGNSKIMTGEHFRLYVPFNLPVTNTHRLSDRSRHAFPACQVNLVFKCASCFILAFEI